MNYLICHLNFQIKKNGQSKARKKGEQITFIRSVNFGNFLKCNYGNIFSQKVGFHENLSIIINLNKGQEKYKPLYENVFHLKDKQMLGHN